MIPYRTDALLKIRESDPRSAGVLNELDRVLAAPQFNRLDKPAKLLRYIVEEVVLGFTPRETQLGVAIFRRDYDPNVHSNVRVAVLLIRSRLKEYYRGVATGSPVRIEIPANQCAAVFSWRSSSAAD